MTTEKINFDVAGQPIVYVRPVKTEDLPDKLRDMATGLDEVYSIHNVDGSCLGLAKDRTMAFAIARGNDLSPVSVH